MTKEAYHYSIANICLTTHIRRHFIILGLLLSSLISFSQNITLSVKDAPLSEVLRNIKNQTDYVVISDAEVLKSSLPVTIEARNEPLKSFLNRLLQQQNLSFVIEDKTIVVSSPQRKKRSGSDFDDDLQRILSAVNVSITGKVLNQEEHPLVGASVTLKTSGRGTTTDAKGDFSLKNINPNETILISYAGYKTMSITAGSNNVLIIKLSPAENELDKVIVQGYGTTTRRLATGNIGSVKAEEIEKHPVMNVLQAIQGQVAGMVVTNNSGFSSGAVKVEIRGRNTLDNEFSGDPLYIIDGVPLTIPEKRVGTSGKMGSQGFAMANFGVTPAYGQSPLFSINPNDIESVEVLKDADATAIYGSRAANGVILITTKKGKSGRSEIQVKANNGWAFINRYYDLMNTEQYLNYRKQAFANSGIDYNTTIRPFDLTRFEQDRYIDWQKTIWGSTGKLHNLQASVAGGDNKTSFRLSAGYNFQNDILTVAGGNNRFSSSFNINHRSTNQKFTVSSTTMLSKTNIDLIRVPENAILLPPNAPDIKNKDGLPNFEEWGNSQELSYPFTPLFSPYSSNTDLLNTSMKIGYELVLGLQIRTTLGYNFSYTEQLSKTPIYAQYPTSITRGNMNVGNSKVNNYILEPQMEYNGFVGRGKINVLAGTTLQDNQSKSTTLSGSQYTSDLMLNSINNAPFKTTFINEEYYKYAGIFGRLGYNYMDKYIINLNGRRDGSSKFGYNRQFGNFGAIGAAWIFTEEKLIKSALPFLSFGKLRASYGLTGGDEIPNYQYVRLWTMRSENNYDGTPLIAPGSPSDSLLQWQVNKKLEIGLNLSFLNDRINIEASWYRNRCDNQLVGFPTPWITGVNNVRSNSPANIENTGVEILINSKIIQHNQFQWNISGNIAFNRNRLKSYPNFEQSPFVGSMVVGYPLNIQRYLRYTGVNSQTGYYEFDDKNKNGEIDIDLSGRTADDRHIFDMTPKFDGGFRSNFTYKNWSAGFFIYFRKQLGKTGVTPTGTAAISGAPNNLPVGMLNYWQKPGDNAEYGRLVLNGNLEEDINNFFFFSDYLLSDVSFIRLQNVEISYRLPRNWMNKMKIKDVALVLQAENIFIITPFKGLDPEVQSFGAMPRPKIINLGLTVNL